MTFGKSKQIIHMDDIQTKGLTPYTTDDYQFFACRGEELRQLTFLLNNHSVSALFSLPKTGKTSLINAGVNNPESLKASNAKAITFDIQPYQKEASPLLQQLIAALNKEVKEPVFLDISFKDDNSLWFAAKKVHIYHKSYKRIYLILDSFENLYTYPDSQQKEFVSSLTNLIYNEIPHSISTQLNSMLMGEKENPLSGDAVTMIYENIKLGVLISVEKSLLQLTASLSPAFSDILKKSIELLPIAADKAEELFESTANQPLEGCPNVVFADGAKQYIISQNISDGIITSPGNMRQIIFDIRKYAGDFKRALITPDTIKESQLFETNTFNKALSRIDDQQQQEKITLFIKNEMLVGNSDETLPAFRTAAINRHGISDKTLGTMVEMNVFNRLVSPSGRQFYQPSGKKIINEFKSAIESYKNKKSQTKHKNQPLFWIVIFIALVSLCTVFLAFSLKQTAEKNSNMARSNSLSTFAFQKLETDPTFSLRLAQKAVQSDTTNQQAYSALLNSFYNTDIFYNISAYLPIHVYSASISNDGQYIMTFEENAEANFYTLHITNADGDEIVAIPHRSQINAAAMSSSGKLVATATEDGTVMIFNLQGHELCKITGLETLRNVEFSPDESKIVTSGSFGQLMVFDTEGNRLATMKGHDEDVYHASFSPDGTLIASAGGDNTARIWSVDGHLIKIIELYEDPRFSSSMFVTAVFSPDGKYLLTGSNDRTNKNHKARLWDLDGNELVVFAGHEEWLNTAFFSNDGQSVITSSRDHTVRVYDLAGELKKILKGHNSVVFSAKFCADNSSIITVGEDNTIRTWSIGKRFETYPDAKNISFASFSPDGLNIVVVKDTVAYLWDLTGEEICRFAGHTAPINTARFSPDGKTVVTASHDGKVKLWGLDGRNIKTFSSHNATVNDAVFSPDGTHLVSVSDDSTIVINNLTDSSCRMVAAHSGCITSIAFSPKGDFFVTGGCDREVQMHDLDGTVIRSFVGHDGRVNSVNFSPDGNMVVSTSTDKSAVLWDKFGNIQFTFRGYENRVNSAVFSPDGKYIVTTSDDGSASIWTIDGKDIIKFKHDGKVSSAIFSPDGKYLLTVYRNSKGIRTIRMRMLNVNDINRHLDQLDMYGTVWMPDDETATKYGM